VYCSTTALAAVPSANAETKLAFITANESMVKSISGRKVSCRRRTAGANTAATTNTRQKAIING
jgi:hypothetical protein